MSGAKGGTRFAMPRTTKISPGAQSKTTLGGTRESQQATTIAEGDCPSGAGSANRSEWKRQKLRRSRS